MSADQAAVDVTQLSRSDGRSKQVTWLYSLHRLTQRRHSAFTGHVAPTGNQGPSGLDSSSGNGKPQSIIEESDLSFVGKLVVASFGGKRRRLPQMLQPGCANFAGGAGTVPRLQADAFCRQQSERRSLIPWLYYSCDELFLLSRCLFDQVWQLDNPIAV